ncbi:epoxide hydrolase [Colletotrichum camelliae]|nr:epoxide hydrolase [Colletotrichum camelliae]
MLPKLPVEDCQLELNHPTPFSVTIDSELLKVTEQKLLYCRFPEEQTDFTDDDWSQGAKVARVRELAEYWRNEYNWKDQEAVPDYGLVTLHYTHTKSFSPNAIPLLFVHGWPGSFLEASRIVEKLTMADHEDDNSPSFHVIAPSIPGFGFSPAPLRSGVGPAVVARAFKVLMTDVLKYTWFVTQGGDLGAFITRWMAIQSPSIVRAQHFNTFPAPAPTFGAAPFAYLRLRMSGILYSRDQSAYIDMQETRPQTLGFALGDSPIGLLAWFVEKLQSWLDVPEALSNDDIINLVMMHWIQGATPGLRFFREAFGDSREADKAFDKHLKTPTGVSIFPGEIMPCPRDWAGQLANIKFWCQHEHGGHFPALECPDDLINDIRKFLCSKEMRKILSKKEN